MPAPFGYGVLTGPKSAPGSIRAWVNYELLDVEGILLDAQAYIYGQLRTREMKQAAQVAIASGEATAPLPTGFLDPLKFAYNDGYGDLELWGETQLLARQSGMRNSDGTLVSCRPDSYAIWGEALQFPTASDAAYAATMLFYQRPPYLGAQHQTNFLTDRYPNILRRACLMYAADDMQDDPQFSKWQSAVNQLIGAANVEADLSSRGAVYHAEVR